MNWLAHVLLSEPTSAFRIGNLLPDLMSASELATTPALFQRGIACHRSIDTFTDRHPIFRRSVQRISTSYRRFAPILVDVFYDHFLSISWERHWPQPLEAFLTDLYTSFDQQRDQLPATVFGHLHQMRTQNWLGSYQDMAGVRLTLERISRRFQRRVELSPAVAELEQNYENLRVDFTEFFLELRAHVEPHLTNRDNSASTPACP